MHIYTVAPNISYSCFLTPDLECLPKRNWSSKILFPSLIRCLIEIYWMCFILQNYQKGQGTMQWPKSVGNHNYRGYFFLSGFSFTDIHDPQDNRGRGNLSLSSTALYHFHLFHRHLDISQEINAESSPMHIASSRTWTRNIFISKCKLLTTKLCWKQLLASVFKFSFYLTTQFTLKI